MSKITDARHRSEDTREITGNMKLADFIPISLLIPVDQPSLLKWILKLKWCIISLIIMNKKYWTIKGSKVVTVKLQALAGCLQCCAEWLCFISFYRSSYWNACLFCGWVVFDQARQSTTVLYNTVISASDLKNHQAENVHSYIFETCLY